MSQQTLFQDDTSAEASRLVVPAEQVNQLRAGDGDYAAEFISAAEEAELLAQIDRAPWLSDLRRRVQHYGYRYDYNERRVTEKSRLGDLPDWVAGVTQKLVRAQVFARPPQQLIVNEYTPGQGIAPHTDSASFGDTVAAVSLGSACMMRMFPHPDRDTDAFDIVLEPRSLVVWRGVSRSVWRHGILPRKSDSQEGKRIPRARRISLTFREVVLS